MAAFNLKSGIIPYIAVSSIIIQLLMKDFSLSSTILWMLIALLGYLGNTWLTTGSTILSHRSAFTILKNIHFL